MNENEVWKDVKDYEGLYQVSDRGNVRSVDRINHIGSRYSGRILKPRYDKDGYLRVSLCKNGIKKIKLIHRLVLEAFVENPSNLPEVNHLDEVKDNNNVKNLEWCDSRYNVNYGTRTERVSKKVRAVNVETGEVVTFSSVSEAGKKGYSCGNVSQASRGIYYGGNLYRGYRWYYEGEVAESKQLRQQPNQ